MTPDPRPEQGAATLRLTEEQADRETLARIIMNSLRGSGGITPNSYTEWTDWRPEADAILASDWLADHDRRVRAEGAREALLNAADALYRGEGLDLEAYADDCYGDWLHDRAAALGTGEEGQG